MYTVGILTIMLGIVDQEQGYSNLAAMKLHKSDI